MAPSPAFLNGTPYPNEGDILLKSHEKRLQNLEMVVQENVKETAACTAQVSALSQQVTEGNAHLVEKLEDGLSRVFDRLDAHKANLDELKAQVQAIGTTVGAHETDLVKLRVVQQKRRTMKKRFRAVSLSAVIAFLGALAERFGDAIWTTFSHHK